MKKLLLCLVITALFAHEIHAQEAKDPYAMFRAAHDYSKTEGIGIYMEAGTEYDGFTDEKINELFNNSVAKHDIKVKVFIDRTDKRKFSIFKVFVFGEGVGVQSNITDFSNYFKKAITIFKSKNSAASSN